MRRAIIALLFCLLILSAGCQKKVTPGPDSSTPNTGGEDASGVSEIEEGLTDAGAVEEELTVGDELDEEFLETLDW